MMLMLKCHVKYLVKPNPMISTCFSAPTHLQGSIYLVIYWMFTVNCRDGLDYGHTHTSLEVSNDVSNDIKIIRINVL